MFAGLGLAALPSGYDEGAQSYWKRVEAEESHAALQALGTYALNNIPGTMPTPGAPPTPPMPPGMRPAIPPVAGPASPPTAGGPAGAPPSPVSAGPMAGPLPGGPPPGFSNPLMSAAGQPQNLTGPAIPPGGMAGPGAGMPPPAGGGGGPAPPPQLPAAAQSMVGRLGPPPPGGYDWRQVVRDIAQANPKADPAVIARAALMMQPLLNQQSQQELRMLNMQLAQERIMQTQQRMDLQSENMGLRRELGERRENRMDRAQDERERENRERDESRKSNFELRKDRYSTLAEQARRRLDQRDQQLLDQKEAALQRAKDRAAQLAASSDKAARRDALLEWKNTMEDYHRSIRERIGAAGILDKKTREAMDAELKEQEAKDKADMAEAERRYKARTPEDAATKDEMSDARERLKKGLQGQQGAAAATPGPGGATAAPAAPQGGLKPIPQAQLPQLQQLIQKFGRGKVIEQLQKQGFDPAGL